MKLSIHLANSFAIAALITASLQTMEHDERRAGANWREQRSDAQDEGRTFRHSSEFDDLLADVEKSFQEGTLILEQVEKLLRVLEQVEELLGEAKRGYSALHAFVETNRDEIFRQAKQLLDQPYNASFTQINNVVAAFILMRDVANWFENKKQKGENESENSLGTLQYNSWLKKQAEKAISDKKLLEAYLVGFKNQGLLDKADLGAEEEATALVAVLPISTSTSGGGSDWINGEGKGDDSLKELAEIWGIPESRGNQAAPTNEMKPWEKIFLAGGVAVGATALLKNIAEYLTNTPQSIKEIELLERDKKA